MSDRIRELYDAIQQNPSDVDVLSELVEALNQSEDWAGLVDLHLYRAEHAEDGAIQSAALRDAAQIASEQLGDAVRAIELYNASLEGDPAHVLTALTQMRRLLKEIEDWENYVEVAQNELELREDPSESALVLLEMGTVFEENVGDLDNAMQCYQVAYEYDNGCVKALWAARRICRGRSEWGTVAELLEIELEVSNEEDTQVGILQELGALYARELEDQAAAQRCYQRLLELSPDDATALAFVGAESGDAQDVRDTEIMENIDERDTELGAPMVASPEAADETQVDDSDGSADSHDHATGDAEHTVTDAAATSELVAGGESVTDADIAEASASESVVSATDISEANVVVDVSGDVEQDSGDAKQEAAEPDDVDEPEDAGIDDEDRALEFLTRLEAAGELEGEAQLDARLAALPFGAGDDVVELYLELVAERPDDIRIYWQGGRKLNVADDVAQRIADSLMDMSEGHEAAVALQAHRLVFGACHLEEARTVDFKLRDLAKKTDPAVVAPWQLQRLLEGEKWRNAQQIVTEQIGGDPGDARLQALREMARLIETRLGRTDKAADFWRQVYQADKSDAEARKALLVAYEAAEKWKEFADVLTQEVESIDADDVEARIEGLTRLVNVINQYLRQDAKVVALYAEILQLDPSNEAALEALSQKYEKMRKWPELVELLRKRADDAAGDERLALLVRVGRVYLEKMRNQMEAITAFEDVLVEDPESEDALNALNELYEKRRDWDNLIATRIRLAERLDAEAGLQAIKELAQYADKKIRRPNLTQQLWEQVLQLSAEDLDARRALSGIYEQTKDWEALATTLDELAELTDSSDEKVKLYSKLGSIFQERLNDRERASAAWKQVLEFDPDNRRARDSYKKSLVQMADWDGLAAFFDGSNNAGELVRLLESQVGVQSETEAKLELLFRAADLYLNELKQSDKAVRTLERVIQVDATNQRAAQMLEPIYVERDDFRKLAGIIQVLLTQETDPSERVRLMLQSAELSETKLRNPMAAFDQLQIALAEDPQQVAAREAFIRLGSTLDQWGTVHDVLADVVDRVESDDERRDIQLTLGRILYDELNAPDDALARYNAVLDAEPDNGSALSAVETIFGQTQRWHDLLDVLETKFALADDDVARLEILREQARIHDVELVDHAAAIDAYATIVGFVPDDDLALSALRRLYAVTEQGDALRDVLSVQLQKAIDEGELDRALEVRLELADVLLNQLDLVDEAIEALEAVLQDEPEHARARQALEGLLGRPEARVSAARLLEPLYVEEGDWQAVVRAVEIRLEEAPDDAARCPLLRRLGSTYAERLRDDAAAFAAYAQLYELAPTEVSTLNLLCGLADGEERWSIVAQLIEAALADIESDERTVQMLKRLASIYELRLDGPGMAVDAYRRALTVQPDETSILHALARLFSVGQQWDELLEIYQQELSYTDDAAAYLEIQFKIAQLLEDLIGEPKAAIGVYRDILDANDAQEDALKSLARLYAAEEMHTELAEIYEIQLAHADDEASVRIQIRLAELRDLKLGEGEQALSIYRSVLENDPRNIDALRALERQLLDPELKGEAASCLIPIYEDMEQWQDLVGAYEVQQDLADEDDERVELLHQIALIQMDKIADPQLAFNTYARALKVQPSNDTTIDSIHSMTEQLSYWAELSVVYSEIVPEVADVDVSTRLHIRLADLYIDRLDETPRAREHYEIAFDNDDANQHVHEALEKIYYRIEEWEALVSLLIRRVEQTEDVDGQKRLLFQVAGLFEEMLEDNERAIDAYQMALEADPNDEDSIDALQRLYLVLERWQDYLDILRQKAELVERVEDKKSVYFMIAQTLEQQLDDAVAAIDAYNEIIALDQADFIALRSLDQLYENLEQWDEQKAVLEAQIELTDGEEGSIDLRFRLANLNDSRLGDIETALEQYGSILEGEPAHQQTLGALEHLVRSGTEATAVVATLEACLRPQSEYGRLVSVWQDLLSVSEDLDERTETRIKIAQVNDEFLGDAHAAFLAYGDTVAEDATHRGALDELEKLALRLGLWRELVERLETVAESIPNELVAKDLFLRTARILDEELKESTEAIARYVRVLEIDPDDDGALVALDRLYLHAESFAELAEVLHIRIERADDIERVDLLMRVGLIYESRLDNQAEALVVYRDVLGLRESHQEAVDGLERIFASGHAEIEIGEILEPLYVEQGLTRKLVSLLESLLPHAGGGSDRSAAIHRIAQLYLEELQAPERAFDWYAEALRAHAADEDARAAVVELAESTSRWSDLATVYHDVLGQSDDLELNRSLSVELADIHRHRLGDSSTARTVLEHAVQEIDPGDVAALKGLAEIYELDHAWPELVETLGRLIESTYDDAERVGYHAQAGRVLEERLDERGLATEQYRALLEYDPEHAETLDRLVAIYQADENWAELFDIYQRQLDIAPTDGEKGVLCAALAQLATDHLARPDDAIDLWNQALEATGEDLGALTALQELYRAQESWREFVDVCERRLALVEDQPEDALSLCLELGHALSEHLGRDTAAIEYYRRVVSIDPFREAAHWALRELFERNDDAEQLANTLGQLLELLNEDDQRCLELHRQLARVFQEQLERPEDAIGCWTNVLALAEGDVEAVDQLEELYTSIEAWRECVGILELKASNTADTYDRVSILFRMAEMSSEQLEDAQGSQRAFEAILEVQPNNLDAYEQLLEAYEAGEQWEALVQLLVGRLEFTDDTYEQVELYSRTAEIFEGKLHSIENAFVVLSQAFEATLDDERFGGELARLAGESGAWGPLIETYQNVIEKVGMTVDSVPMRLRVAEWWDEKFQSAENAAIHYQNILSIEPDNLQALSALEVLLERHESWEQTVEVLQRKVELTTEPDERKRAYEKMASVLDTHLDRHDDAIDAYRQAMLLDPSDLTVLNALERLYTARQRWEDLIEVLNHQAQILTDEEEIMEKYLQIGDLWETRMLSPDRAIDGYRQALSIDDRCLDAMRALEKLYVQEENWIEAQDILELMLETVESMERKVEVYHRLARLQQESMQDIEGAIDTYRRVIGIRPGNVEAVEALEAALSGQERWDELVDVYSLHLEAVDDIEYVQTVRTLMGDIVRSKINDPVRAIEVLEPILVDMPDHVQTVRTLAELHNELEDWPKALDMMQRQVDLEDDNQVRIKRMLRMGDIYREHLDDLDAAEKWYRKGFELDRSDSELLSALKAVHIARSQWREAVQILQMIEAAAPDLEEKSRCLYEIGRLYDTELEEKDMAVDYCEQAIDLWPDNADAAEMLIDVYWQDGQFARVEPLLDLLLRQHDGKDPRYAQDLNYRLGKVAHELRKVDKALQHYRRAYELDSTHLPTLQGMGEILVAQEDWDRAFKIFQTILVHHRDTLDDAQAAQMYNRQGFIKLQVGEKRKALDFYRKSLDSNPQYRESLVAVSEIHESRGDWDDVVHYRRRLIEMLEPGIERTEALLSIGDILGERLSNARGALEIYQSVLDEEPGSKMVLGKMLGLHESTKNWPAAVDTLTTLAELEDNASRKAKYWCGVATIQQRYLEDRFLAVRSFDNALDADPTMLRAFEAIDQMLTEDRDYERQDRYYRKMLKRAMESQLDDKLVFSLAKNLGEINRSRLKRFDEAAKAYKIALTRKPDDPGITQILAQLYELDDDSGQAIAQYQTLLQQDPKNIDHYRTLKRLYLEADMIDEAWCVSQVLVFLNKASQEDRTFFEKHRSRTFREAKRPLDSANWDALRHEKKSKLLDLFFTKVARYALDPMSMTHKDLGIHKRKDLVDSSQKTPFNTILAYAAQTLRTNQPDCYTDPGNRSGLHVLNLNPPALAVGNDVVRGARMQELAFMAAKQLTLMGAQHILASFDTHYEHRKERLKTTVYTVMKLVNPAANVKAHEDLLRDIGATMQQADAAELAKVIKKLSANPAQHLDVSNWLEGLEYTLNRVGLLIANDLQSAAAVLKTEAGGFSRASTSDRVRELILFSISPAYFGLRKTLGFSIDSQA